MDRTVRIDPEELEWSLSLSAAERIRQANAAFRLFHALHAPFAQPVARGFASIDELHQFEKEHFGRP